MPSGSGSGVPPDQAGELRRVKLTMEPLGDPRQLRQLGGVTFQVGYQPRRQPRLPLAREQPEQVRAAVALTVSPPLNGYRARTRPPQVSHRQPMLAAHLLGLVQQAPRLASLAKRNLAQLTALIKTRLKRMPYRPSLLDGFLAATRLDLTPP